MATVQQHASTQDRLPGLDILRGLAAGLVFLQHTLSSCHNDEAIDVAGFRVGRIGTAIFFMLGGFLCARSSRRPMQWLKDRLFALLPAYWIVTAVGFGIAFVVKSKSFDAWQVICQFAGVGYLTHGDRLINVSTWFITPLLFFYGVAALLRLADSRIMTLVAVLGFAGLAALDDSGYTTVLCHGATFFAAFAVSRYGKPNLFLNAIPTVLFGALCLIQPEFRYASLASFLLLGGIRVTRSVPFAGKFTTIAFEWFLVHGIVITGASRLFANPVPVMLISVPVSLIIASLLKRITATAVGLVVRRSTKSANGAPCILPNNAGCASIESRMASDLTPAGQHVSAVLMRNSEGGTKQDRRPVGV